MDWILALCVSLIVYDCHAMGAQTASRSWRIWTPCLTSLSSGVSSLHSWYIVGLSIPLPGASALLSTRLHICIAEPLVL